MPKQALIAQVLRVESLVFTIAVDFENVKDCFTAWIGVVDVLFYHFEVRMVGIERAEVAVEVIVLCISGMRL